MARVHKVSLHIRVLGIGLFVLLALFVFALYCYQAAENDALFERLTIKARYMGHIIEQLLEKLPAEKSDEALKEGLARLLDLDPEIESMRLSLLSTGAVVATVERAKRDHTAEKSVEIDRPCVGRPGLPLVRLQVSFWQQPVWWDFRFSALNAVIVADLAVLMGLILHLLLRELVTLPFEGFVEATRRVAAGELSEGVSLSGRSLEEERLARSFNEMVARLRTSRAELSRVNAELEERVLSRTDELREAKAASDTVIATVADGLYTVDKDRIVRMFNGAAEQLTGLKAAEVIGKPCYEALKYPFCETHCILHRLHAHRGPRRATELSEEYFEEFTDKGRTWLVTGAVFEDRDGFQGGVETIKDLSPTRRLQQKVRQMDRLTSMGVLSAGVAHEINNPLSNIKIHGQLLREDLERRQNASGPLMESLDNILSQTDRASEIVRKMLDFARESPAAHEPVEIGEIVSRSLHMVQYMLESSGIELDLQIEPGLPRLMASRVGLQQVFVNLFENARQAMKAGGCLRVKAWQAPSSNQIQVAVSDTGAGIRPADASRIFDPFFTTKDLGEGTGLGLSICYGIIKDHRGDIAVDSTEGRGATFTISLPAGGA